MGLLIEEGESNELFWGQGGVGEGTFWSDFMEGVIFK